MQFGKVSLPEKIKRCRKFSAPYGVTDGKKFRLKDVKPGDIGDLTSEAKPQAKEALAMGVETLARAAGAALRPGPLGDPPRLPGHGRRRQGRRHQARDVRRQSAGLPGVLLQGAIGGGSRPRLPLALPEGACPSAGGSGSSTAPTTRRCSWCGCTRSFSPRQKLPPSLVTKSIWKDRYEDICNVERYLGRNGVLIRKFFLHVSKKEQKKRFLERLDNPDKNWKFSMADAKERGFWNDYQEAYEDMIRATASKDAPWYVVPADNKWFTRIVVAAAIIDALGSLNLEFPKVDDAKKAELAAARTALEQE